MLFALSKLLVFFLRPIVWIFIVFIFASFSKNRLRRKRLFITGFSMLFIFSNSFIVGKIFNCYEADYPEVETYDYGLVLGGFSSVNKRTNEIIFNSSADRINQTVLLYKKGIIKYILASGGNGNLVNTNKEADMVYRYLHTIGIPDSVLITENQSRNTIENARNSAKLIKNINPNARILVITSAWHIPRAKRIFNKYFKGNINYYPTNYIGKTEYNWSDFIIPSSDSLVNWDFLIKEWVGLVVDRFRN
jgi:uncharacterized SAM-binding protein YcdF (DUF218 family)